MRAADPATPSEAARRLAAARAELLRAAYSAHDGARAAALARIADALAHADRLAGGAWGAYLASGRMPAARAARIGAMLRAAAATMRAH